MQRGAESAGTRGGVRDKDRENTFLDLQIGLWMVVYW